MKSGVDDKGGHHVMADMTAPRHYVPAFAGIYSAFEPFALPALRIVLGLTLVPHGCQKLFGWFGGAGFDKFTEIFGQDRVLSRRVLGDGGRADGNCGRPYAGLRVPDALCRRRDLDLHDQCGVGDLRQGIFLDAGRFGIFAADRDGRAGLPDQRRRTLFRRSRALSAASFDIGTSSKWRVANGLSAIRHSLSVQRVHSMAT